MCNLVKETFPSCLPVLLKQSLPVLVLVLIFSKVYLSTFNMVSEVLGLVIKKDLPQESEVR